MIKVPKQISIYPHRPDNLSYLLLWIPEEDFYKATGQNARKTSELKNFYPQGLELPFNGESLDEYSIAVIAKDEIEPLYEAYQELFEAKLLDESNIVALNRLRQYLKEREKKPIQKTVEQFADGKISLNKVQQQAVLRKVSKPPIFKGDEAPEEAYKRMSSSED